MLRYKALGLQNQRDLLRKGRKGDKYIVQVPEDMKSKTKVDAEGKPVPVKKATPKSPVGSPPALLRARL